MIVLRNMIDVGSTVGNYQIVSLIGRGAMGSVYLAQHPVIGKRVALKVIHPELINNAEVVGRFFNEARAITQIGHPNVVEVQDFFQAPDGECVIIMEFLEGSNLAERIKQKGTLSIERSIHIAIQIADGLGSAHSRNIIHRDVKPDNVLLIKRGADEDFVKLVDFGLAKLAAGPGGLMHKTKTGTMLGTPFYMAPESAEARSPVDHRVDVYALGCILFQMVTGRVPFLGDGYGDVLIKHVTVPPPLPSRINPAVPPALEKIILHALAKKPEFRFATMEKFRKALQDPTTFARSLDDAALITSGEGLPAPNLAQTLQETPTYETAPKTIADLPATKVGPEAETLIGSDLPAEVKRAREEAGQRMAAAETLLKTDNAGARVAPPDAVTLDNPAPPVRSASSRETGAVPPIDSRSRKRPSATGPVIIGIALGIVGVVALFGIGWLAYRFVAVPLGWAGAEVAVSLTSQPSQADVFLGEERVGVTPVVLRVPRSQDALWIKLKKPGFIDVERDLAPRDDHAISVRLLARPEPTPAEKPSPSASPSPSPSASPSPSPSAAVSPPGDAPSPSPAASPGLKKKKPQRSGDRLLLSPSF